MCWKFELEGSHEMTAEVDVIEDPLTQVGPTGQSLPITIVHAASRDVLLFGVTERTLIRCS